MINDKNIPQYKQYKPVKAQYNFTSADFIALDIVPNM